ncbi:raftlin-like [Babylonia areolata]|uniref:raftlin-like n=1 Tax=Babylonia areolata TaxID=304850 RepID=UPI003FD582C5
MGGATSSHDWQPPPQPQASISSGRPVDYHMVACQVVLDQDFETCACFPKVRVTMHSDDLYTMLSEQFSKGYRMVYFTRKPGHLQFKSNQTVQVFFTGFFRINPNLTDCLEGPVTWSLRVERSWVQSQITDVGGFMSLKQTRMVRINNLVDSIARNTQHGERLVAATETGHSEAQSYGEYSSGLSPHVAIDLFFEVPHPAPREHYVYNIALIPVHVEYPFRGNVFFPEIQCDWMATFQHHLSQGWRLIDIYIDTPMVEQFRVPMKQRANFCRPNDTEAVWIFERPASVASQPRPLYEGTIMEQTVGLHSSTWGVKSEVDWLPVIRDMGMRGWELSCVVESHKVEGGGWADIASSIKSLLFFQRPLKGN